MQPVAIEEFPNKNLQICHFSFLNYLERSRHHDDIHSNIYTKTPCFFDVFVFGSLSKLSWDSDIP